MSEIFNQGHAVVIGVGADLPVTIEDANAIANVLSDAQRCAYPSDHVILLTGEKARREHILSALDWLIRSADPESTTIVYFSGHGLETPDYYLMPFGYDLSNLQMTAISGMTFTERLRAIRAKKLLVLLDCCHAGGQAEAKVGVKSPVPSTVIDQLGKSSGRVVIASSRKDEVSFTGRPYSIFTEALLEALSGYGVFEQDGYARVLDLAMWVGRKVPELTGDKQHPIIKVSNLEDNFAVAWYAAGDKEPRPLPNWTENAPTISSRLDTAQIASWQRRLANFRYNLLMIEERMSEYAEFTAIPLQLIRDKQLTEVTIVELEQKLGLNAEREKTK